MRCWFDPWVGKISWRRGWQLYPAFLPENHPDRRVWRATIHQVAEGAMTEVTEQARTMKFAIYCTIPYIHRVLSPPPLPDSRRCSSPKKGHRGLTSSHFTLFSFLSSWKPLIRFLSLSFFLFWKIHINGFI